MAIDKKADRVEREAAPAVANETFGFSDQRKAVSDALDAKGPGFKHMFESNSVDAESLERRNLVIVRRADLYGPACTNPDAALKVRDDIVVKQRSDIANLQKDQGQQRSLKMLEDALAKSEDRKEMAQAILTRKRKTMEPVRKLD